MISFLNGLMGVQTAESADLSRRSFLGVMGGLAATALVGCGSNETIAPDGGIHPQVDGGGGTDSGADAGTLTYRIETGYAQLPCQYPSDLDAYTGKILTVCTPGGSMPGDNNQISQFDPASAARPIPSSTLLDLEDVSGRSLNKLSQLSATLGVVTANDGLYEVRLTGAGLPRFITFPSGTTYATGALRVGNKLFVTTANLDVASSTYNPGTLQIYDLATDGSILETTRRSIPTSRKNPTGLALRNANTLVVLNSGDYSPMAASSLDLIDPATEAISNTIPLGTLTAQNTDKIALSPDGDTAVIGSADGTGRVLFVNLQTGAVTPQILSGTQFHSSIRIGDGRVFVTDFNTGLLTILDLATQAVLQSLNLMTDQAGPSELLGHDLIQAMPYGAVRVYAG